jgi:hypothetical protein
MLFGMDRLGIDIGGVIIQPSDEDPHTSFFGGNFLATPAMPGVFEAIGRLAGSGFGEHVYLVSKCGEQTERHIRRWLDHHEFYARTGVCPEHVRFCRTRPAKAPIAEELGLTHFVDDRLEVLGYLTTVAHRYLFRPREAELRSYAGQLAGVHRVESWPELAALLAPR